MNRLKPGPGWKHIAGSVWQNGELRLHLLGTAALTRTGGMAFANSWPESKHVDWFIRVNGGNRRRGLMAWARAWEHEHHQQHPGDAGMGE